MLPMHRQVLLLASAQALFQTASVLVMTVGSLAGAVLSPAPEWATAPIASMFLGTALGTVPASMWMARVGRRTGFVAGAAIGAAGGVMAALGIFAGSLFLLCIGTLLVGIYQAFAQFYRFAASEVADDAFRPRAISLVLAGGVVAALAGPALARIGGEWLQPIYSGSFLLLAIVSMLAAGLLLGLRIPAAAASADKGATARPMAVIAKQPTYLVALFGAATGYGIMILAMTATPLAMVHHHHSLADASIVIQLHVLGMFLPSFVTGSLIARFGVLTVMGAGIAILAGHVLLTLSGTGFYSFAGALILLGIGWNFLYIGGTNLLTRTYTAAERGKAQAANDFTIFIVGLLASLSAGVLQQAVGWQIMNLVLLPWLALAAAAVLWLMIGRPRSAEA
ncbi:Major facilitator superfamily MFS_1 [Devosia sp. LC5]|uniref:MFS transporter n=1 Tax=Devosia sp. LC5 TaxID=1502724 RepID=UPI0004E3E4EF|nr:MFS transporter [Devosia sp. LC5]KFC71216.1 Major facilitator superfamily MFS_1 [Devosia sp. LC5]